MLFSNSVRIGTTGPRFSFTITLITSRLAFSLRATITAWAKSFRAAAGTRGPLVTYNERPGTAPNIGFALENVGTEEEPDWQPPQDLSTPPWPSQPDGAILGAPLQVHGPGGALYRYQPYFNFYHINWVFEESGRGHSEGFFASHGAFSPFPNATQWVDDGQARHWPGGPFWAYGSAIDHPSVFRLKDPYITDTDGVFEQGGTGACLVKCKWAETIDAPEPPGKDFVFKDWNFNFRDFFESYRWCATVWGRNNVEIPQGSPCPGLSGCAPVRFTPIAIAPPELGAGYYIGPGSYWISQMNCSLQHYDYTCCKPAIYVQPNSPGPECNGVFIPMPPAVCDETYGSLWMGRVDQSTSDAHACDNYVANRNSGVANPASCEPQIELDLIRHPTGAYETFVAPLGFNYGGGTPICEKPSINSLDRYIEVKVPEACVEAVGGVQKFGLELIGSNGEKYSVSLVNAVIHQPKPEYSVPIKDDNGTVIGQQQVQEGPFFPDAEVQRMDPEDCKPPISVIKEGGYYRFVTVFDSLTGVRVAITKDGQTVGSWQYYLKAYAPMADLIQQLESVFNETWWNRGGPPAIVLEGTAGLNPPFNRENRSLIARCCSAVFQKVETAVKAGVVLYIEGVKIAVLGAQGYVQGFWAGVKNDANNVAQLYNLLRHPIDTGKALYEGFRGLVDMGWEGIKQIPKKGSVAAFVGDGFKQFCTGSA